LAGDGDVRGIYERLETGKLDFSEAQFGCAGKRL